MYFVWINNGKCRKSFDETEMYRQGLESLVTSAGRFDLVVVLWILGDYINRSHCRIVVFY